MKTLKILFLLLLMIPSIASADYTFYVENSDMVDSYFNIFNAIAMLFQSDSYIDLLRLVFLFGGFFVFIGGILQGFGKDGKGALSGYATYTITGFAFLSIVFSSPTTLWIESETLPSYCSASSTTTGVAVGNIPNVLAYTFATINSVGRGMTQIAETAFTVPTATGNTSMKDSGGYLGSLKQAIKILTLESNTVMLKGANPINLDGGFKSFYSECILIPFSAHPDGKPIIAQILSSGNIFEYINDLYSPSGTVTVNGTPVRDYLINSYGETWTCGGMYDTVLKPAFTSFAAQSSCAINGSSGALQLLTGIKGAPVSKFEEIAQNAAILNQMEGVNKDLGVSVSGSGYAAGKTKADFIQTSFASGSYFAEMLPYLQMTLRAILYAFFPFVFIVVMLPGGMKVITQYMQTLLWIELWSPTAAIVNMFVLKKAENDMGGKYISDQGLTLINSMQMLESATTISAIGAYLYASVPALTWLILKGSGDMLGNVAGAMGAKMATNIQTDSINKDAEKIDKSNKTGLSISEQERYEAIARSSKVAGDTISQMRFGGHAAIQQQAEVSMASALGQTSQQSASAQHALSSALGGTEQLRKTAAMKEYMDENGNLNAKGIETAKQLGNKDYIETETGRKSMEDFKSMFGDKYADVVSTGGAAKATMDQSTALKHMEMAGITNSKGEFTKDGAEKIANARATIATKEDFQKSEIVSNLLLASGKEDTLENRKSIAEYASKVDALKDVKGLKKEEEIQKLNQQYFGGTKLTAGIASSNVAAAGEQGDTAARTQYLKEVMGADFDPNKGMTKEQQKKQSAFEENWGRVQEFSKSTGISEMKSLEALGVNAKELGNSQAIQKAISKYTQDKTKALTGGSDKSVVTDSSQVAGIKAATDIDATKALVQQKGETALVKQGSEVQQANFGASLGGARAEETKGQDLANQTVSGFEDLKSDALDAINKDKKYDSLSADAKNSLASMKALDSMAQNNIYSGQATANAYGERLSALNNKYESLSKKPMSEPLKKAFTGMNKYIQTLEKERAENSKGGKLTGARLDKDRKLNGTINALKSSDLYKNGYNEVNKEKIQAAYKKEYTKLNNDFKPYLNVSKNGSLTARDNVKNMTVSDQTQFSKQRSQAKLDAVDLRGVQLTQTRNLATGKLETDVDTIEKGQKRVSSGTNDAGFYALDSGIVDKNTVASLNKLGEVAGTVIGGKLAVVKPFVELGGKKAIQKTAQVVEKTISKGYDPKKKL